MVVTVKLVVNLIAVALEILSMVLAVQGIVGEVVMFVFYVIVTVVS